MTRTQKFWKFPSEPNIIISNYPAAGRVWSARGKTCPNGWPTDRPAGRVSYSPPSYKSTSSPIDCSSFHVALDPHFDFSILVSGVIETNRLVLTCWSMNNALPNYTRYLIERLLPRESTCASYLLWITYSPHLDSAMTALHC